MEEMVYKVQVIGWQIAEQCGFKQIKLLHNKSQDLFFLRKTLDILRRYSNKL